jgi:protein-ribulosamine 3-kinase
MMRGEYTSVMEITKVLPDLMPAPYGWGKYKHGDRPTYFYLSEFVDMDVTTVPEPIEFTQKVAELHRKLTSANGKFGFHVTTCDGKCAHVVEWEDEWAVFFVKLIRGVAKLDSETNGSWPKLELALDHVLNKVVPRLIGALQSEGQKIVPSLIHGDLWEGNVGANMETGNIVLFDAGSYYAHNEMELGMWRHQINQHIRTTAYRRNYLRNFPVAEPADEFDDRNRLYSLKYNLNYSAGHPGNVTRQTYVPS